MRRWRCLLHLLWLAPAALFMFLWMRAGWDIRYLVRVLWHRDASTSDYEWKAHAPVAASSQPVAWPVAPACDRVRAAFARDPETRDLDAYLAGGRALAFVVIHDGAIACEWYGNGGGVDRPAMAFSVSKTVIALLLARAVADHRIGSLGDPITAYIPELHARDARFDAITLAELVDMRSGLAFEEETSFPWVDHDAPAVYYASDLARTAIERPRIERAPGAFLYNDYAPNLVGVALERATGTRLAPGPMQALWNELGATQPAAWLVDGHGFAWHESGLVVTARDLARIGQLVLDGGKVGDRQVAPASWVARSTDPAGRTIIQTFAGTQLGYRNGWWILGDHDLVAMGHYGQIMVVSLTTRTVIVRLGKDGNDETNVSIARRLARIADEL
ncbi:MAG TPA: serine hydrolase [Kofleriaceae bacterium]|nr:serine hydrolase [Kofleriaceae bacterium]